MRASPEEQADALEASLSAEDRDLLDSVARGIAARRLTVPAVFILESVKPLNLVASSALIMLRPILATVWRTEGSYDRVVELLNHRGAIELLLRRLEAHG